MTKKKLKTIEPEAARAAQQRRAIAKERRALSTEQSHIAAAGKRYTPGKTRNKPPRIVSSEAIALDDAVTYARVSSTTQVVRGHGLDSQETRCLEYIQRKGYTFKAAFRNDMSGSLVTRPGMQALLAYLRRNPGTRVIIDDISRLARGLEAHLQLRAAISAAGGVLESPSIEFGEDSDAILVEHLLASVSEHQRRKNGEQVKNRMRARAMNGYWVFPAMAGYKFEKVPGHDKLLVRDEPVASILQEVLEGFAAGRFSSLSEVKAFLDATPEWPKPPSGEVHTQSLEYIFPRVIYAGYIDLPQWDISLVKGKHEPLISFDTWSKIIERIEGNSYAPTRADLHEDFPLRGLVTCGCCGNKLTAAWSKGRSKLYPYYVCHTRGCPEKGKSIRKETMESAFEALLRRLQPAPNLFKLASAMLRDLWDTRLSRAEQGATHVAKEIAAIEAKTGQLVERLVATDSPALISAYEGQIVKLEEQKTALIDSEVSTGRPQTTFEAVSRTALTFLANPWKLWASGSFQLQRTVLKLAFAGPLPHCRNQGRRTADLSLPFRLLQDLRDGDLRMVGGAGIEPATPTV